MTIGLSEQLPGKLIDTLSLAGVSSIAVASTGVAYGHSFPLFRGVTFGWEVQFASSGSVNVKVELEQGNARPATEGSSDTAWAVPDNKTTALFTGVTDTNVHFQAYSPNATAFGRLKYTGISGNDATTTVTKARVYTIKNN